LAVLVPVVERRSDSVTNIRDAPWPFAWVGLATSDPPRATVFYAELFGWRTSDIATRAIGTVTILSAGREDVAILYAQTAPARAARVAPHWTAFIGVRDADATVSDARRHGATILRQPFRVLDYGRVATLADPTGSILSLWQPLARTGATRTNAVNAHCWTELSTSDLTRARSFYGAVFGWSYRDESPEHTRVVDVAGPGISMRIRHERRASLEGWLPYFMVENPSAVAAKAQRLGGEQLGDASVGDSALIADPTGARFAVLSEASSVLAG